MARKRRQDIDRAAVFEAILGDLGGDETVAAVGGVALAELSFNEHQPRKHFSADGLAGLAASIRDQGVLEPIIVRRVGSGYQVVAGERRTRAAKIAGLSEIPAVVVDIDDREALEIAITENLQREDLNAVEETEAVMGLLEITLERSRSEVVEVLQALYNEERGRLGSRELSVEDRGDTQTVFRRLGRFTVSSFVSNRLPILEFPPEVLEAVRSGELAFTKAQAIVRVVDGRARNRLLKDAVAEGLTVSQLRRRITELRRGHNVIAGGDSSESTQRLVSDTKRLLSKRRLAALDDQQLQRVTRLLDELRQVLSEE